VTVRIHTTSNANPDTATAGVNGTRPRLQITMSVTCRIRSSVIAEQSALFGNKLVIYLKTNV